MEQILLFQHFCTFLLCHGDIESNPGPKWLKSNYFSICHWNLNSISAHFSSLKACTSIYKYDFICLSEKYLDSPKHLNENSLQIESYNHSHHQKRKDSLERQTVFSWILILTWNFGGGRSDSASTFFKKAGSSCFWCYTCFYIQSIFDPCPKNCLSFSKKSP